MSEQRPYREFTRTELYGLVWAQPLRSLAQEFGLSDVGLSKACRKANIPVPPRGHWAKKKASKPVQWQPLPPRFPGAADKVVIGGDRYYWYRDWRKDALEKPVPPVPSFAEDMDALSARARKLVGRVVCPRNFDNTHWLIRDLLAQDKERCAKQAKYSWSTDAPKYDAGIERRRLIILNGIFLAVQRLSCAPSMNASRYAADTPDSRGISVRVGDCHISFTLEPVKAKASHTSAGRKSERLRLAFGSPRDRSPPDLYWQDSDGHRVETMLTEIVVAFLVEAEQRHRHSVVWARDRLIEEKAKVEREIAEKRAEQERRRVEAIERQRKARIDSLLAQAADLHRADTIRAYVRTARERMSDDDPGSLDAWVRWALAEADRIDPTKNGAVAAAIAELPREPEQGVPDEGPAGLDGEPAD